MKTIYLTKRSDIMAKKKTTAREGEQMDLIEWQPENKKEIVRVARAYRAKVKERLSIQNGRNGEVELKEKLMDLVKAAHPTRNEKGVIRFKLDGLKIEVKPTKETITVTEDD